MAVYLYSRVSILYWSTSLTLLCVCVCVVGERRRGSSAKVMRDDAFPLSLSLSLSLARARECKIMHAAQDIKQEREKLPFNNDTLYRVDELSLSPPFGRASQEHLMDYNYFFCGTPQSQSPKLENLHRHKTPQNFRAEISEKNVCHIFCLALQ